jgi:aminocarboxymuconate-semialdehyde decarboxylase
MNHGIDVHTHIVPEQFPPYAGKHDTPWPTMAADGPDQAHVMIAGKKYRTVACTCWNTTKRAQQMDTMRIARQALSPMPELLSYWFPLEDGRAMCRFLNETIAAMVQREPARFYGLGAVPLQDVDAAIDELRFVVKDLKLCGVEIASHVNGVSIGDARFQPFFAAAEALGAAIFVHALRPAGKDRLVGPAALEQIVAFPGDIALAGASLITGGTLEKCPNLRLALSHGGGALTMVVPRLQHCWTQNKALQEAIPVEPRKTAARLYVDSLVYDPVALRAVLRIFGPDHVMIGTDFPFVVMDHTPHASIDAIEPDPALAQALREGNARRFLGVAV